MGAPGGGGDRGPLTGTAGGRCGGHSGGGGFVAPGTSGGGDQKAAHRHGNEVSTLLCCPLRCRDSLQRCRTSSGAGGESRSTGAQSGPTAGAFPQYARNPSHSR